MKTEQRCSRCKQMLLAKAFNRNSSKTSGLNDACKPCARERERKDKICKQCSKPFIAAGNSTQFCSGKCAFASRGDQHGERNANWKGGITISQKGYAYVFKPDHPKSSNGYVKRATLILEAKLGRYLNDNEIAHHVNRNKLDDSPENLEAMSTSEHAQLHGDERRKHKLRFKKNPKQRHFDFMKLTKKYTKKTVIQAPSRNRFNWPIDLLQQAETKTLRQLSAEIGCSHVAVWARIKKLTAS